MPRLVDLVVPDTPDAAAEQEDDENDNMGKRAPWQRNSSQSGSSESFMRRRAAAEQALRAALCDGPDPAAAVRALLDALSALGGGDEQEPKSSSDGQEGDSDDEELSNETNKGGVSNESGAGAELEAPIPQSPSELNRARPGRCSSFGRSLALAQTKTRATREKVAERLKVALLPRWFEELRASAAGIDSRNRVRDGGARWRAAVGAVAGRALSAPDDATAVALLAALAARGLMSGAEAGVVGSAALRAMKGQVQALNIYIYVSTSFK